MPIRKTKVFCFTITITTTITMTTTILAIFLNGCDSVVKDWVRGGGSKTPNTSEPSVSPEYVDNLAWDFADSTEYNYDSNYVEIINGSVLLKQVDQFYSGSDFDDGIHVGTHVDGSGYLTLNASSYAEHNSIWTPSYANLVAYFKLNGTWTNEFGTGDFVVAGDSSFHKNGKIGFSGAIFDGDGDRVDATLTGQAALNFNNDFTLSYWLNVDITHDNPSNVIVRPIQLLCTGANGYLLSSWIYDGADPNVGDLSNKIYDGTTAFTSTSPAISGLEYDHYIFIRRGTIIETYINGVLTKSTSISVAVTGATCPFLTLAGTNYKGLVDDVALWDTSLLSQDVLTIYNRQASLYANDTSLNQSWTPKYSNIVGYWKMDGNWQDSSGNGNHMIAQDNATFTSINTVGTQGAVFDGMGDYLEGANFIDLNTDDLSLSLWFKMDSAPGDNLGMVSKGAGTSTSSGYVLIYYNPSQVFRFYIGNGSTRLSVTSDVQNLIDKNWHHLILSVDRDGLTSYYLDGKIFGGSPSVHSGEDVDSSSFIRLGSWNGSWEWPGGLDDVAIWKGVALSKTQAILIYNRQKQKYAGHYESPIIDLGSIESWTNLTPITTLPFYKELTGASGSESSSDYSLLVGSTGVTSDNDLMIELKGLWHFEEVSSGASPDGNDLTDYSNTNYHLKNIGGVKYSSIGPLKKSFYYDGVDDCSHLTASTFPNIGPNYTLSSWVKPMDLNGIEQRIVDISSGTLTLRIRSFGEWSFHWNDTGGSTDGMQGGVVEEGVWTHIVGTHNGVVAKIYVNGTLVSQKNSTSVVHTGRYLAIGCSYYSSSVNLPFIGSIDETSIWNRTLTPNEIQQVYRRGANRIKYQVKSCIDSACNCVAFSGANPTSVDCNGDGVLNVNETDFTGVAQWLGRDGATGESFSELQSCSVIDYTTGECDAVAMATVNTAAPSFNFSQFPVTARPVNNRYFQYRILMEAERNLACNGGAEACMPELTSIEVGPTGRYFGETQIITSNIPVAFNDINNIDFLETGSCSIKYQLSLAGSTYVYWDGSQWGGANDITQSTSGSEIAKNISLFSIQVGSGNLFWKALMSSDTAQSCEISAIPVSVTQ